MPRGNVATHVATEAKSEPVKMTGAEMIVECLKQQGASLIFGYPGGTVLPIYDVLYDAGIEHVLTRHEQGAIHAAEGFARATGKAGVVLATSGPGATNLVTGITDAYMDSTPLVILTGQVPTTMIGRDAFQEADIMGITMPITKHNYQIRDAADIPRIIKEAFHIATTGRPGPVLIDIPKNVQQQTATFNPLGEVSIRGYNPTVQPHPMGIERLSEAIKQAKKPILYVGGGIIHAEASEALTAFARQAKIPVVSTLMGLGSFPQKDQLFLGMLGMHGTYAANKAVFECDLLIACGVRFDDRVTGKLERFSPKSKKAHIDIDPAEIGKNVAVDIPIVGDVGRALQALIEKAPVADSGDWLQQVQQWVKDYPLEYKKEDGLLKPQQVIDMIQEATGGKAIVTTEVGQHQMWAAHFYKPAAPRSFITSGGLGTMGYGFPAAMGAQLARPGDTVICIAGDASIQMNIQELQTVSERNIPVKVMILNNGYLGMVRQWQEMMYESRYSESRIGQPDFVKVAEAFDVMGIRAKTEEEAKEAIHKALAHPGPVVVDFAVAEEENVFPMVPPGAGNDEMVGGRWEE